MQTTLMAFGIVAVALGAPLAACGGDEGVSSDPLSGEIFGDDMTVVTGIGQILDSRISIWLFPSVTTCADDWNPLPNISADVPAALGTYADVNVVFWGGFAEPPFNNFSSTVVIDAITETGISGRLSSYATADTFAEGSFVTTFCPPASASPRVAADDLHLELEGHAVHAQDLGADAIDQLE